MPNKRGPNTYKGYQSPETKGWPEPIRKEVKHVYGAYRRKNPDEPKARAARIAWSTARRKYPKLYAQHTRREKAIRKEMKEHPWAGRKTATRIASDHEKIKPERMDRARSDYVQSNLNLEDNMRKNLK